MINVVKKEAEDMPWRQQIQPMAAKPEPHFFSVIIFPAVQLRQLQIPKNFVYKHGSQLPDHVLLQAPKGKLWPVELVKQKGEIWLVHGWPEFATYYSIGYGQFLVFRYNWNSCFHVIIFNLGAVEINYPSNLHQRTHDAGDRGPSIIEIENEDDDESFSDESESNENEDEDDDDDDYSSEVLEDHPPGCFKKAKQKTTSTHYDECSEILTGKGIAVTQAVSTKTVKSYASLNQEVTREHVTIDNAKEMVVRRPEAFKSQNPHFFICMPPSYVLSTYRLYVPRSHSLAYFKFKDKKSKNNTIFLHGIKDGKTWPVQYDYNSWKSKRVRFSSGWKDFVLDNKVQVGDVCVFELIDRMTKSYRVTIFRINCDDDDVNVSACKTCTTRILNHSPHRSIKRLKREPSSVGKQRGNGTVADKIAPKQTNIKRAKNHVSSTANDRVRQRATAFKSKNPHFVIYMHPSYVSSGTSVYIPQSYSQIYFNKINGDDNFITLRGTNRSKTWTVKYFVENNNSRTARLGGGWFNFTLENDLRVGDACVFELINVKAKVYRVTIFRMDEFNA